MKFKKIVVGISLAGLLLLGGCSKKAHNHSQIKHVGVLQVVQHPSLDKAYKGFKKGLKEGGYTEGKNLKIDYQNAQNSQDNLKSMSEKLINDKSDLILGIATPAAQSIANATEDIPTVVTAVTDLKAAKLVNSNSKPGRNVTGTTDMVSIDKQIELLLSIVPKAKTIGVMYNAGESNSKIQADLAIAALKKAGVKVLVKTANTTNDVQQVTETLANKVQGIYVPTDNTFASAASIIGKVVKEKKIPLVAGSTDQIKHGGLASIGIDYEELGKQTGKMAAKILDGKAKPSDMPVEKANQLNLVVNKEMAKALGINPKSIKAPK
ncbi:MULTISPECIES: ABC transporter substrate-binding protein [unclassified Lactobacillus]|uniref:ABC transporter substrate-binding protein n=1 Tax=unclassified Lactobacillus TaxID=2620435 RepID=UPI000EFC5E65|nr:MULTISPECIES: ABC transporter substrate-binding protein [unclassified Lactobacillus]RMC41905.1 ABC transporter substrate-binding protein [Lactobacillus sp. ESL0237]RMC45295.1 ABC transporter substrate-binding protein [Lactobacillus sp. ESL0234]RMC46896.1 ABC transporter substrate-binding protein [Lactobacillus sp. ESL0236]RMC47193.1 ABC transporter substrate-binding protein [Lactobacillus sp. ESL0230]RMC51855.1 ABC transporter substrate-binding protein [Lactobacillus sp. ESL0225]